MTGHLLESTLFAICVAALAWALRRNRASVRHWLWFSASVKFLLPFAMLTSLGKQVEPVAPAVAANVAAVVEEAPVLPQVIFFTAPAPPTDWTPWLLGLWACGALAVAVSRLRAWLRIRAVMRASRPIDLQLPIEVRESPGLLEPGVAGIWRPVLLLPVGIREFLSPPQFDAIVAHEMADVRRGDNLLSLVHMVVEATFWFHPLVWWIGSRLVEERERACDEAVIAAGNDPADYSEAIVSVCRRYVESPLASVAGVTGADLKVRLEAIFRHDVLGLTWARKLLLVSAALLATLLPFVGGIVSAQEKSFEVASIRLVDPNAPAPGQGKGKSGGGGGPGFLLDGGRFSFSATTYSLIMRALGTHGFMASLRGEERPYVTGGPDWIRKDTYAVQATVPPGTRNYRALQFFEGEAVEIDSMLASLLRDRFALRYHRESREMQAFALNLARNGHKMRPTQAKMVTWPDGHEGPERAFFFSRDAGQRVVRLRVVNASMAEVAQMFSDILDRPVLDRSGLAGAFDFDMEYAADVDNPGVRTELTGPELFTALQEQAGLRLESTRAPVEVVVIDSIERPSEN